MTTDNQAGAEPSKPRKFRQKPMVAAVTAVQWFPDERFGQFRGERYINRKIGVDALGVEYTIGDVVFRAANGTIRIFPGDWICAQEINRKINRWIVTPDIFEATYEPAE